jgi:glycosyltransferase involved in cell wall biosynthesis
MHKEISKLSELYRKGNYKEALAAMDKNLKLKKLWSYRAYDYLSELNNKLKSKLNYSTSKSNEYFFTIITVNYNNLQGLKKTAQSVINQTNRDNIQFIVVDGGSTDGSIEYIQSIVKDIDIAVYGKDDGVYDAMNRGIKMASGHYCNFMNSGDCFYDLAVTENIQNKTKGLKSLPSAIYGDTKLENGHIWKAHSLDDMWKGMKFSHQSVFIETKELKSKPYDMSKKIVADYIQLYEMHNKNSDFFNAEMVISDVEDVGISGDFVGRTMERWQAVRGVKNPCVSQKQIDDFYRTFLSASDNPWTASHTFKTNKAQSDLIANTQERIIFLISMPRSGSTLLQRILEQSDQVNTLGEPWLMLPLLSGYSEELVDTKYGQHLNVMAKNDFLENTNNLNIIKDAQQVYADSVYSSILRESDKRYFLDKTPRYIHVAEQLKEIYPNAKFIVLLRNPAAIISSYAHTWFDGSFEKLAEDKYCKYDFEKGFESLSSFSNSGFKNMHVLRYEELVSKPDKTLPALFKYLKMPFQASYINYNQKQNVIKKFKFGDPKTVYSKQAPDVLHSDKWIKDITETNSQENFVNILNLLPNNVFNSLGYSKESILENLGFDLLASSLDKISEKFGSNEKSLIKLRAQFNFKSEKSLGVLITSYNNQSTIINAIRSVVEQTKEPDLIIIADDVSTDDSVKLIAEYISDKTHLNIKLIAREENLGVSKNRDLAINDMNVDYITTLDGDDIFFPGKLEAEYLSLENQLDRVAFSDIIIETTDNVFKQDTSAFHKKTKKEMLELLSTRGAPVPRDMMFPKILFEKSGGFDHQLKAYEDWALKMRMVCSSKDFSWVSTNCIGTIYDRKTPGLSNLANIEHVINQVLVLARNIDNFASNKELLSKALLNLCSLLNSGIKTRFKKYAEELIYSDFEEVLKPNFDVFWVEYYKNEEKDDSFNLLWKFCKS